MDAQKDIIQVVREACGKKVLFLPHAIRQMSRVDRMITTPEVHMVIDNGEVIEDYPEDVRGHSCLVLGCGEDMKCIYCKGEMVRKTAPFHIDRKGYHLLFDAIPAWVCGQCGEAYFEEAEVDAIQKVLRKIDKETEKLVAAN